MTIEQTISDLIPSWRRALRASNRSVRTIDSYMLAANQLTEYLDSHGLPLDVTEIEPNHIWSYLSHVLDTRASATARHLVSDGAFGEGSVYSESGKVAGMKYQTEWTVTHFDPISKQVHFGVESSMQLELTWTLAEIDAQNTRATQVVNVTMMPRFRPLGVLIEKLFVTRKMTNDLEALRDDFKRIAEAEAAAN